MARVCRKRVVSSKSDGGQIPNDTVNNYMPQTTDDTKVDGEEEVYHIHALSGKIDPYVTELKIDGKNIPFEIDTGAGLMTFSY